MSYSFKTTPTGGSFTSHITKKAFAWEKDKTGQSKRQALADLRADEKVYRDARERRRPATPRPDHASRVISTTHEEKLAQTQLVGHKPRWQEQGTGGRVEELQRRLAGAKTPGEVAAIHRRLEAMGQAQQRGESKAATRQAQDDARTNPEYLAALADSDKVLDSLSRRDDVSEDFVIAARYNVINLKRSANVEAYRESEKQLSDKYQLEADSRVAAATDSIEKLKASISGVIQPIEVEVSSDATE